MSEEQKVKKKTKEHTSIKDFFSEIGEYIIGEVIFNILLFIPRMIGKLLKAIFS